MPNNHRRIPRGDSRGRRKQEEQKPVLPPAIQPSSASELSSFLLAAMTEVRSGLLSPSQGNAIRGLGIGALRVEEAAIKYGQLDEDGKGYNLTLGMRRRQQRPAALAAV